MGRIFGCLAFLLAGHLGLLAQIGVGTTTPHPSSMMHISPGAGSNKGLIVPEISSASRVVLDSTQNIAHGLIFFDTDLQKFYYFHESPKQWFELDHDWIRKDVPGAAAVVGTHLYSGVSGNVGIGTAPTINPGSKLTVVGNMVVGTAAYTQDSTPGVNGVSIGTWLGVGTRTQTAGFVVNVKGNVKIQGNETLTGDVSANRFFGEGAVPPGTVSMWSGTINTSTNFLTNGNGVVGTAYEGWAICNGSNGTPDLRGRFIVGGKFGTAGGTNGGYNNTTEYNRAEYAPGSNSLGGEANHLLDPTEMPQHNHSINHGHSITDPGHTHGVYANSTTGSNGGLDDETNAGAYWGKISTNTTGVTVDNHSGNSGNAGGSIAFDNRPPYFVLLYIMKKP